MSAAYGRTVGAVVRALLLFRLYFALGIALRLSIYADSITLIFALPFSILPLLLAGSKQLLSGSASACCSCGR